MASKISKTGAARPPRKRSAKTATPSPQPLVTPAQRQRMIETAAYYLAEKNGFTGDAAKFWIQAEREVDAKLGLKK